MSKTKTDATTAGKKTVQELHLMDIGDKSLLKELNSKLLSGWQVVQMLAVQQNAESYVAVLIEK